jgi:hypothetical protein
MTITRTGYEKDTQGSWIAKDPQAQLIYSMDWVDWLPAGDSIQSVEYTLQVRANDPEPLVKESQGMQGTNNHLTYVELSGGQRGKVYTVTAAIVTVNQLQDRRSFRIKVEDRQL